MTYVQPPRVDNEALPITGVLAHFRLHEVKATAEPSKPGVGRSAGGEARG